MKKESCPIFAKKRFLETEIYILNDFSMEVGYNLDKKSIIKIVLILSLIKRIEIFGLYKQKHYRQKH
jgi:hypothetical protein